MYGREVFWSGFGKVSFEGWLATGVSELTGDLAGRYHYEPVASGSAPEAAASLLIRKGLAREEDGYPAPSNQGGLTRADYSETLAEAHHGTQPGTFVLLAGGTGGSGWPRYRFSAEATAVAHPGEAITVKIDDVYERTKRSGWTRRIPQAID